MLVFKSTASFVADFSPDCESALASVPYLSASISLYHHDPGTNRTKRIRADKGAGLLYRTAPSPSHSTGSLHCTAVVCSILRGYRA